MEETLAEALAALFERPTPAFPLPLGPAGPSPKLPPNSRAREALSHFDRATTQLKAGDWGGYGSELEAIRLLLAKLSERPSAVEPGPRSAFHASPVQNKLWWGRGIHLTPGGWLYNVAGLESVEIVMRDGKRFRIGSDDADMLARALNRGQIRASRPARS